MGAMIKTDDLPWPSATVKSARRPLVALLATARVAQAKATRRKTSAYVQRTVPPRLLQVSRTGDFTERLDEITLAEAHCAPCYETEGLR